MPVSISQIYFFALLTIGSIIYLLRQSLLSPGPFGPQNHKQDHKQDQVRQLAPTEVAYLIRKSDGAGDGGFALIVLLFDMVHREIKEKLVGGAIETIESNQISYEL